jgi:hypothetical protein
VVDTIKNVGTMELPWRLQIRIHGVWVVMYVAVKQLSEVMSTKIWVRGRLKR